MYSTQCLTNPCMAPLAEKVEGMAYSQYTPMQANVTHNTALICLVLEDAYSRSVLLTTKA